MHPGPAPAEYSIELFRAFIPGPVLRRLGDGLSVPLISSALIAEQKEALFGPSLEVSWAGASALAGALRAVRHIDGIAAVRIPTVLLPDAPGVAERVVEGVVAVAEEACFDRPLSLVGGVILKGQGDRAIEQLEADLLARAHAGFTAVSLRPATLDPVLLEALPRAVQPLLEMGVGLELDFAREDDAAFLLAQIDELGLPLAAVRGAGPDDELGGGLFVVDPLHDELPVDAPLRVSLDAFVVKGIARALLGADGEQVVACARDRGSSEAIEEALPLLMNLEEPERARLEAFVYAEVEAACFALCADGVAGDLLAALAEQLAKDELTSRGVPPGEE